MCVRFHVFPFFCSLFALSSLLEEMYSVDDVTSLLNSIQEIVRSNVRSESTKYSHQVVLYLRNIFLQAEGYGVQLQVDTAQLEDA